MKPFVIGLGELLWDVLPSGPRMGGAPANFACHARALGAEAAVITRVGRDPSGTQLISCLNELDVLTTGISRDAGHATGTVMVDLGADGQPHFTITGDVAWDHLKIGASLKRMAAKADALCFGTLGQRCEPSRAAIRKLVAATPQSALRIFDVNLRQDFYSGELIHESLELANVMKLSDGELPIISDLLGLNGTVRDQLETLLERYNLRMVAFTRGSNGSVLWDGSYWCENPGLTTNVRDTIGAGDSFTTAVALGMLHGWPIEQISANANEVAAYVCSCVGAIPPMPESLRLRFQWSVVNAPKNDEPIGDFTSLPGTVPAL